jgi:hypothetical protein
VIDDLGSLTGADDKGLAHRSKLLFISTGFYDPVARDILYRNKGVAYAYYMILNQIARDYASIIDMKHVRDVWDLALGELKKAAEQHPILVSNTSADEWFFNTHLAAQGYFIAQARARLGEVHDIVSK